MLREAARAPAALGVNSTTMVHLAPAATEELQVLAWLKSAALAPVKLMFEMLKATLPVLVRVTACVGAARVTGSAPKVRLEAERLTWAPPSTPARLTV